MHFRHNRYLDPDYVSNLTRSHAARRQERERQIRREEAR